MTTSEKCEAILWKLVRCADTGKRVELKSDLGGNTVKVCIGNAHTHCGIPDGTWEQLINSLHGRICEGRGLSWA